MLGADASTLGHAREYGAIILAGSILSTGFSAIVRAEGRLAYSMLLWVVPVIVQIVLVISFFIGSNAWTTMISITSVMALPCYLFCTLFLFKIAIKKEYPKGIFASRNAARVIGVENNRDAVRDAISNAKANRADNVRFYTADASDFLQGMAKAGEHADVIILDPPRAGSDERFLAAVTAVGPERVVYVSCNPETLARDLGYLTRHGYRVTRIQPVDMFPHTEHIEVAVALVKS